MGDGQLRAGLERESPQIREASKLFGNGYNPSLIFIVVKKRINTKFFAMNGKPGNVNSGTVVDDVVTQPERYRVLVRKSF